MNPLENYAAQLEIRNTFIESHREILTTWEKILANVSKAEMEVVEYCKKQKEDAQAGNTVFKFTQPYKKWIDFDAALLEVPEDKLDMLNSITTVKKEVDMKKFIDLCREGVFPDSARIVAYREEAMSPRVTKSDVE